jgi:signal peptidase
VGIYLIINYQLPGPFSWSFSLYVIQPLLWLSLGGMALLLALWSRLGLPVSRFLIITAGVVGIFQLSLFMLAGLLAGFGYSPYSSDLQNMARNLVYVGSALVGAELSRAYLVAVIARRSPLLALAVVSALYTVIVIPMSRFRSVSDPESGFELAGGTVLPGASESLLASFLALVGGPGASIAYRGILQAFDWYSPILPDLDWKVMAFVGTLAPCAGLLIIRGLLADGGSSEDEATAKPTASATPWIFVATAMAAMVWFSVGLFGVQPRLVSGVSMEPTLAVGDIAITRGVDAQDVKQGDIIIYDGTGGASVIHRVIEVYSEGGGTVFITQGDNNNAPDPPVIADQVQGEVVLVVPKVGWAGIFVKNLIARLL